MGEVRDFLHVLSDCFTKIHDRIHSIKELNFILRELPDEIIRLADTSGWFDTLVRYKLFVWLQTLELKEE